MKTQVLSLFILFIFLLCSFEIHAISATPYPVEVKQPDGTTITIRIKGNEFFSYKTTLDGYPVIKGQSGFYHYAQIDGKGNFIDSSIKVSEIGKRAETEQNFINQLTAFPDLKGVQITNTSFKVRDTDNPPPPKGHPTSGSPKCLVILVNYSDVKFITPNPQEAFTRLLNAPEYSENSATGSVRDYFVDSSSGKFSPEFVVAGPYDLPRARAYYGSKNPLTNMENSRQMVKDACSVADENGFDFTSFDNNDDGYVDNVSIIFAGYNEAEGGPEESIWPHRYVLADPFTMHDDKRIYDFMCISELRSNIGGRMCGVGTFIHEFSHILGLKDYYATNGSSHHTLSYWSVMDVGPYLNEGRTPPAYSAYDRFYLDWISPRELIDPQKVTLQPLTNSNTACIITKDGNHNMNGVNPNPREFFTLENRQQTGWDTYLPGHGLLITRIYYNSTTWNGNTVNNDPYAMGIDIIEADGTGSPYSLSGDTYPGTSNVYSFFPTSINGVDYEKPIEYIRENDGVITFHFMGGNVPELIAKYNLEGFSTVQGTASEFQEIIVSGKKLESDIDLSFETAEHFEIKLAEESVTEWNKSIKLTPKDKEVADTKILIRYNPAEPSFETTHTDKLLITALDAEPLQILIEGNSTRPVLVTTPLANPATEVTAGSFVANWTEVYDATGYYLTAYAIPEGSSVFTEGFNNGLNPPEGWIINAVEITENALHYGEQKPAIRFNNTDEYIETEEYLWIAKTLSFHLKSIGANGNLIVEGWNEKEWKTIEDITLTYNMQRTKSYEFEENDNYRKFRISYSKKSGSVAIDDIKIETTKEIRLILNQYWVETTSHKLENLENDKDYVYRVKASDRTLYEDGSVKYENITNFSNWILAHTSNNVGIDFETVEESIFEVITNNPHERIYVYDTSGKKLKDLPSAISSWEEIKRLPKEQVYIIQIGRYYKKIVL